MVERFPVKEEAAGSNPVVTAGARDRLVEDAGLCPRIGGFDPRRAPQGRQCYVGGNRSRKPDRPRGRGFDSFAFRSTNPEGEQLAGGCVRQPVPAQMALHGLRNRHPSWISGESV